MHTNLCVVEPSGIFSLRWHHAKFQTKINLFHSCLKLTHIVHVTSLTWNLFFMYQQKWQL